MQVEVLGVSRITFEHLSGKLPRRCNLPAHDCVRLLRSISFAQIAILDLAHKRSLFNKVFLVVFLIVVVVYLLWY